MKNCKNYKIVDNLCQIQDWKTFKILTTFATFNAIMSFHFRKMLLLGTREHVAPRGCFQSSSFILYVDDWLFVKYLLDI